MDFNIKTFGLWALIWLVGYGLGLLEAKIKNDNKERREKAVSDTIMNEALPHPSPPAPPENELLSVFERVSGVLKLRIDGEMVEYQSDLDAEKRARLLKIVVALRPWLEKSPEKAVSPAPVVAQKPVLATPPPPVKSVEKPLTEVEQNLEKITTSKLSMVEQIDKILQRKLAGHPLEKEKIYLRTALNGTLLILIGTREYEWIDDIPEQPIQDIIREAIAEWENSAS